jgi:hypothetical protein
MKCEAAHVRRAGESGTGYKAEYSIVPMCRNDHSLQHDHGETAAYQAADQPIGGCNTAEIKQLAKEWFNKKRIEYLVKWCWQKLKADLGHDSWSDVPPGDLKNWAQLNDVAGHGSMWLPRCYYDTYPEQ